MELYTRATRNGEKIDINRCRRISISSKSVPVAFKIGRTPVLNKVLTYITPRFIVKASVENVYFDKSKVTESLVDRYFELTLREGNRQAFVDRFKMAKDTSAYKIKHIQQPTLIYGERTIY
jgi:hypothetical protein